MTTEQKEAIETMQHWIEYEKQNKDKINKADELIEIQETVLNLIQEQEKEIEKYKKLYQKALDDAVVTAHYNMQKDKQIDLMAEVMFKSNKAQLLIEYGIENKEQIIKEFEKLVKEKGE